MYNCVQFKNIQLKAVQTFVWGGDGGSEVGVGVGCDCWGQDTFRLGYLDIIIKLLWKNTLSLFRVSDLAF